MAGWGSKTDWYRNACTNPQAQIQIGRRKFDARAEIIPREEVAQILGEIIILNPRAVKMFQRWVDSLRVVVGGNPGTLHRSGYPECLEFTDRRQHQWYPVNHRQF